MAATFFKNPGADRALLKAATGVDEKTSGFFPKSRYFSPELDAKARMMGERGKLNLPSTKPLTSFGSTPGRELASQAAALNQLLKENSAPAPQNKPASDVFGLVNAQANTYRFTHK